MHPNILQSNMPFRFKKHMSAFHLSISGKLTVAVGAIVSILVVTTAISILEFRRMSTYVSDLISENITTINLSTELAVSVDEYNLAILGVVGRADDISKSDLDVESVRKDADRIFAALDSRMYVYEDSLKTAFENFYSTSLQLDSIIISDFVDTREWYFTRLQPQYNILQKNMDSFNVKVYDALKSNSVSFDESFYRGIMPTVVSVAAAIALCLLLHFFIIVYYVKPLRRMLKGLDNYKQNYQGYSMTFEGDDELQSLNGSISDIIDENISLKKRLKNRES